MNYTWNSANNLRIFIRKDFQRRSLKIRFNETSLDKNINKNFIS